jgi:glycosyltransferase involved in cell wall biosynthesis
MQKMSSNKIKKDEKIKQNIIRKIIVFILIINILIPKVINRNIINNSKISIIIPTYNRAKIISKAIQSCLEQAYNSIEIIIIDDCSKDNTKEVIKKIKDMRIKYIKLLSHKGASYSRNIGIKKAKGRYISFLDSDDISLPEKLKIQINNLIKHNSDLDFCKVNRIYGEHKKIIPNKIQVNIIKNGNIYDELLTHGNFISTQTILVKKKHIEKYLFDEDMPSLQDYELLIRMLPSIKVSFTNKILVNSYLQNDSITNYRSKIKNAVRLLLKKKYIIFQEIFISI